MEKESFEDEEVAQLLNRNFISIKVDREERPDIDHIYMMVCQAMTGHGGWPLTVIMTPEKVPFYTGTYFPKHDRMRMPGLISIIKNISEVWRNNKKAIIDSSSKIIESISENKLEDTEESAYLSDNESEDAYLKFKQDFDSVYGGFGSAPKFPSPHNLFFLLRYWYKTGKKEALEMVEKTLEAMHNGGIYDHIGFGFSRYSTDRKWLVPHFEKMLYDNALLAIAYLEAYQATGTINYAKIAEEIFTYILRDMTAPEGGFYSAEDADSEGIEGRFYLWDKSEIDAVLGKEDSTKLCRHYNITEEGNFEGRNIINLIDNHATDEFRDNRYISSINSSENVNGEHKGWFEQDETFINSCREKLFSYREKRIHPYKDDKILTAWNGLMIAALSIGGRVLKNDKYSDAAERAAKFILQKLTRPDGRLLARYREGDAALPAYIDDYAFLTWGLTELYETTFDPEYLLQALILNDNMLKLFWDKKDGGLFIYGSDSEQLIMRPKEIYDGAVPSGNSVAALNLIRLSRLSGDPTFENHAELIFKAFSHELKAYPRAYPFTMLALLYKQSKSKEIIIVPGKDKGNAEKMLNIANSGFNPFNTVLLFSSNSNQLKKIAPFIEGYTDLDGKATAYVCENQACMAPVTDIGVLTEMLQ